MAGTTNQLKCILLTLQTENVILPNAAVAEIVPSRDVVEVPDAPPWMLGRMQWRGYDVPLVSFELAGGKAGSVSTSTQIAVLYSTSANSEYPYLGLAISGVPHISVFRREQIRPDASAAENHPMVARKIRVNGAAASILDIQAMESMLKQVVPASSAAEA